MSPFWQIKTENLIVLMQFVFAHGNWAGPIEGVKAYNIM